MRCSTSGDLAACSAAKTAVQDLWCRGNLLIVFGLIPVNRGDAVQLDAEDPRLARVPRWECELRATEALYIPRRWWHEVTATSASLSVSFWWT